MRKKEKKRASGSLTEGVIWKQLLLFALPLLGSSFIQQLYNTVDLLFAGNLIGKNATAAVGASSLVITCMIGFFTGLSVGTGVVVSQAVGAKDEKKTDRLIHTSMGLSLLGGAFLSAAGIPLTRTLLIFMDTPPEILNSAVSYMQIYLLSMIPLVTYNMLSGVIRACGDSRAPMVIQLAGGIVNVAMDYISIRFLHMGVQGVAWATMFSQGAAAVLCVCYLMRPAAPYRLEWRRVRIHRDLLAAVLKVGVPAGFQSMVITLSNLFVQYKINGLGVEAVAAFSVYFKVELLIYLPIVAFGQAMTTFAGQNVGAGKPERVRGGVKTSMLMGVGYAFFSAFLLLFFGETVFAWFNRDPDVIACGLRVIRVTFPFYWLYVILEVLADTLRGSGKSVQPMCIILLNLCVIRTVLLAVFSRIWGNLEAVAAVYPAAWFLASACFVLYWFRCSDFMGACGFYTPDRSENLSQ